jgi:FkbM family methyltransferase
MRKKWLGAFRRRLAGAAFTTHYCSHYMCDVSRKSSAWKHEERESRMKNQLNSFLNGLGYSVVSSKRMHLLELLKACREENVVQLLRNIAASRSQLRQDLFVLSMLGFKRNGFFVEFGAANGELHSNTYLLEKEFGWKGIVAEPARHWHENLKKNRSCNIETDCVWSESNLILKFNETDTTELSTVNSYSSSDSHKHNRKRGQVYEVKTISLNDLLDKYNAPNEIDYLSIDTEGSEYQILSAFDFDRYKFKVITVEHNFTERRDDIYRLLTGKGYGRRFEELSEFDDWYVRV